jgi:hypothetical protein
VLVSFVAGAGPVEAHHVSAGADGRYAWCALSLSDASAVPFNASITAKVSCTAQSAFQASQTAGVNVCWKKDGFATYATTSYNATLSVGSPTTRGQWTATGGPNQASGTWTAQQGASGSNCGGAASQFPSLGVVVLATGIDVRNTGIAAGNFTFSPNHFGLVVYQAESSAYPSYPLAGGSMPPPPTVTCSVDVASGDGLFRAQFNSTATNTTSYSWAFSDGGTSTAQDPAHNFATGDNAGAKWTAVVTVSGDGGTDDCALSFDFFGADHVEGDAPGGGGDPECEDLGWWPVTNALKKLFLPCGPSVAEKADELWSTAEDNWPIGAVTDAISLGSDVADDVNDGSTSEGYTSEYEAPGDREECNYLDLPIDPRPDMSGDEGNLRLFEMCDAGHDDTQSPWMSGLRNITRGVTTLFAAFMGVALIRNSARDILDH